MYHEIIQWIIHYERDLTLDWYWKGLQSGMTIPCENGINKGSIFLWFRFLAGSRNWCFYWLIGKCVLHIHEVWLGGIDAGGKNTWMARHLGSWITDDYKTWMPICLALPGSFQSIWGLCLIKEATGHFRRWGVKSSTIHSTQVTLFCMLCMLFQKILSLLMILRKHHCYLEMSLPCLASWSRELCSLV